MEKHTCKLCFRSFANGRALGGHMRSHVVSTAKAAASPQLIKDDSSSSPPSESSSSFRDNDDVDDVADAKGVTAMVMGPLGYGLRENPKKSFRLVDPEFSSNFPAIDASFSAAAAAAAVGSSIVVQDRESETESPTTHRRRSKRARKSEAVTDPPPPEPEPVSSVSDTTPEEDVAISLMILSRDIWTTPMTKSEDHQSQYHHQRFVLEDDDKEEEEYEIDIAASASASASASRVRNHHHHPVVKGRSKYQCGTCKKVFRSYQALGGHRASHKKTNGCVPPSAAVKASTHTTQIHEIVSAEAIVESRVQHECPVCYRVFSSGQALGGHKRSHLTSSSAATITVTSSSIAPTPPVAAAAAAKYGESLIDLNLPAPMEDDAELSAVSDAEFVMVRSSK